MTLDELTEKLADLEHQRWSRWHLHAVKNWTPERVKRWTKLAKTSYVELTEELKEKDRLEVQHGLALVLGWVEQEQTQRMRCRCDKCRAIEKNE
jgi:hypothetical protein